MLYKYDGKPYHGIIQAHDEIELEVKCMSRIGHNRFFWPAMVDICLYSLSDVINLIDEPKRVTERRDHCQVDPQVWVKVEESV